MKGTAKEAVKKNKKHGTKISKKNADVLKYLNKESSKADTSDKDWSDEDYQVENSSTLKENDDDFGGELSDAAIMISGSEASDEEKQDDKSKSLINAPSGVSGVRYSPLQAYCNSTPTKGFQSKTSGQAPTSTITKMH